MSNSEIRLAIPAGKVRSYSFDSDTTEKTLDMLGVGYTQKAVQDMKDRKNYADVAWFKYEERDAK